MHLYVAIGIIAAYAVLALGTAYWLAKCHSVPYDANEADDMAERAASLAEHIQDLPRL